jgi:hypothetical protein
LVREAVERFLDEETNRAERVQRALQLADSLSDEAADALEASVREVRSTWRW